MSTTTYSNADRMKSLNSDFRKRENERIERENHGLALRLFVGTGVINTKSIGQQYQQA